MMAARREKAAHTGGLKVALKVAQRASTRRSPTRSLVDLNPSPPTCSAAPERVGMLSQPSPAHTTPGGRAAAGQPAGAQRDSIAELNTFLRTTNSITQAKAKVEACLREGRENHREFFRMSFGLLVDRIFNFQDGSDAWLQRACGGGSKAESNARALVELLSPDGVLFQAMLAADQQEFQTWENYSGSFELWQYVFPKERLPLHTQRLMRTKQGQAALAELTHYRGRLAANGAHLSVYEWFLFWLAFYFRSAPATPGAGYATATPRGGNGVAHPLPTSPFKTSPGGGGGGGGGGGSAGDHGITTPGATWAQQAASHLSERVGGLLPGHYAPVEAETELLLRHLHHLLPEVARSAYARHAAELSSAAAPLPPPRSLLGDAAQGELILSILIDFWLSDEEAAPMDPLTSSSLHTATPRSTRFAPAAASPYTPVQSVEPHRLGLSPGYVPQSANLAVRYTSGGYTPAGGYTPTGGYTPAYTPPTERLVASLSLLVGFLFSPPPASKASSKAAAAAAAAAAPPLSPGTRVEAGPVVSYAAAVQASALQAIQRPLYGFLRKAFTQWQPESSASVLPVVRLWLLFLCPWEHDKPTPSRTDRKLDSTLFHTPGGSGGGGSGGASGGGPGGGAGGSGGVCAKASGIMGSLGRLGAELQMSIQHGGAGLGSAASGHARGFGSGGGSPGASHAESPRSGGGGGSGRRVYDPQWQGYVEANLPFYSVLLHHFLTMCYRRIQVNERDTVLALREVVGALRRQTEVWRVLKAVDDAHRGYRDGHVQHARYAAVAEETHAQLRDWEEPWAGGGGGGTGMAGMGPTGPTPGRQSSDCCLDVLSSEAVRQMMSALVTHVSQLRTGTPADRRVRDELNAEACAVFNLTPPTVAAIPSPSSTPGMASAVKKGWAPGLEFRVGSRQPDVCPYRGDWMRRPIAHNEVAPLVRLLVWLSDVINAKLELGQRPPSPPPAVEPTSGALAMNGGFGSPMRSSPDDAAPVGFRVNLRFLAEKQMLALSLALLIAVWIGSKLR